MFRIMWLSTLFLIVENQEVQNSFQDLGKLLLAGVIAAVVIAIAFVLIQMRIRDKKPRASSFTSIGAKADEQ